MPGTDRSVTLMTGMIIAALCVVMLVGFTRESYMWRDAAMLAEASGDRPVFHDVSKRVCRTEQSMCPAPLKDASQQPSCSVSVDAIGQFASRPAFPLTLEGLRRTMRAGP